MASYNRPTLSPIEPQASQFSLHTPVDAQPPDDSQYQPQHPPYSSENPYNPSTSYQMQPTPQPARSPPPTFEYSQMSHPNPHPTSPPPAFDPHAPAPMARDGPADYAPPPHAEYPPPPQQEFAPPPQDPNHYPPPPGLEGRPPMPPEPIATPGYNASDSTGPLTPKTPIYTPGGAAGPNGGVHAPGQISHPNQQHGRETYKHGLCNCFSDIGTCCTGYWCPCILYSRTQHRLKTAPNSNLNGFSAFNGHCALFCVAAPVSWVFTMLQRTRIRENYRLEGSVGGDCAKAYCCVMCTLVQDDREVAEREDERRRHAGPGSGVAGDGGYRRASGMVYG
ncbi:PLAC8 family-domain-containing protein [Geopyxis carbonaria]|nr:PLAC8 family-domain-containing protein [Geopyxis carbonaria]